MLCFNINAYYIVIEMLNADSVCCGAFSRRQGSLKNILETTDIRKLIHHCCAFYRRNVFSWASVPSSSLMSFCPYVCCSPLSVDLRENSCKSLTLMLGHIYCSLVLLQEVMKLSVGIKDHINTGGLLLEHHLATSRPHWADEWSGVERLHLHHKHTCTCKHMYKFCQNTGIYHLCWY